MSPRVNYSTKAKGTCPVCGKTTTRAKTFTAEVEDGKGFAEALARVTVAAAHWKPDHTHHRCKENQA